MSTVKFSRYPLTDAKAAMEREWEAKSYRMRNKMESDEGEVPRSRYMQSYEMWHDALRNLDAVCRR